jgi:serine-type D-Ala-D-Ala endopeptidase (penicillin-binding protein 7)
MTSRRSQPGFVAIAAAVCVSFGLLAGSAPARAATENPPRTAKKSTQGQKKAAASATKSTKPVYSASAAKARSSSLSQARVAARMRMMRESALPRYKTDASGAVVPDLHAAAAIVYNPETGEVVWEENSHDKRSIASITKVMTAVILFESDPDLSHVVTVDRTDTLGASTTHLRAGYQVPVRDLLHLLLISSDNAAARALARTSPWGPAGFVARMNEKATELGLQSTNYADPSGLDPANISSAYDMARLITYAAGDERISEIMQKPDYTLRLARRPVSIRSTNQLLSRTDMEGSVLGAKTGFIARSGYCLATLLKMPQVNQPVAVVVLGARTNAARFTEVRNLFNWMSAKAQDLVKDPE